MMKYISIRFFLLFLLLFFIKINETTIWAQDINQVDSLNKCFLATENDTDKVSLLTKIAVHYWYNNPDTAVVIAEKALHIAEKMNYKIGIANSLHVIGYAYFIEGNYPLALEYNLRALVIRETIEDLKGMGRSYNNIGNIYLDQKEYEKAKIYYEKGLELATAQNNTKDIALLLNNLGRLDYFTGKYEESLEKYEMAYRISESNGYEFELMLSQLNSGRSNAVLQNYSLAKVQLLAGLQLAERMKNYEKVSMALTEMATISFTENKIEESVKYAQAALRAADTIKSLSYMNNAALLLFKAYEKMGDYKTAIHYFKISSTAKDSMFNENRQIEIGNLQSTYELEKSKKEIELLEKDMLLVKESERNQQLLTLLFAVGFSVFLLLALVFFKGKQKELRAKRLLTNKNLIITEQNTALQQKNDEITAQRNEIEDKRNKIIQQKKDIEHINKSLTDSIVYASKIQCTMLPVFEEDLQKCFQEYFIIYQPRDIVSGDFYWTKLIGDFLYFAAADCTGHGVPGALMSMLSISLLNEFTTTNLPEPAEILNNIRNRIKVMLRQNDNNIDAKDGMDIALCKYSIASQELVYAGAYNPLFLVRDNSLNVVSADKMPIGVHPKDFNEFTNKIIPLLKGDRLFLFSDGLHSQFGGEMMRKFSIRRLKELIVETTNESMKLQEQRIRESFLLWKGNYRQIDDVLLLGVGV